MSRLAAELLVSTHEDRSIMEQRQKILSWLSPPTSRPPVTARREPGTNLWFLESDTFRSWIDGRSSYIFVHGHVGCGKTMLNKAIADAQELEDARVVAFYFTSTTNERHGLNALLRYLVVQLFQQDDIPTKLQTAYEKHSRVIPPEVPDDLELQNLVEHLLTTPQSPSKEVGPCYLLIDGLDEIQPRSRRRDVLEYLNILSARRPPQLRVLATSRPAEIVTSLSPGWMLVSIPADRVRDDIELYVRRRLSDYRDPPVLDEIARQQIVDRLAAPQQSMFRYAYLQLERLLDSGLLLRPDIPQILLDLPPTLEETYSAILNEIKPLHQDIALKAFRWLVYCQQPLLMKELIEACMISTSGGDIFRTDQRLTGQQMLTLLPNLVAIESLDSEDAPGGYHADEGHVVFAHFSVKEYLVDHMPPPLRSHYDLGPRGSHTAIATACVLYLAETNILHVQVDGHLLLTYARELWPLHLALGRLGMRDALDGPQYPEQLATSILLAARNETLLKVLISGLPPGNDVVLLRRGLRQLLHSGALSIDLPRR